MTPVSSPGSPVLNTKRVILLLGVTKGKPISTHGHMHLRNLGGLKEFAYSAGGKSMSMQAFDHPRATRYNVKISTVIVKYHTSGASGRIAEGRNISRNGMAIILPHDLQVGARVQLTLPVLGEPMHFEGVIRNRDHYTYGVAFVNAAEEQRNRLASYCSAMALASAL